MVLFRKTESHKAELTKYRLQKAEKLKRQKLIESKRVRGTITNKFFSHILSFQKQLDPLTARKGTPYS